MEIALTRGSLRAAAETMGGELVSLRAEGGPERIWQGDPAYWSGRDPVLFPAVGNLKDKTARFGGRSYPMERHGFARRSAFRVEERREDAVTFLLEDGPQTREHYPFRFALRVRHSLTDTGFTTRFRVTNGGDVPMPFCIGAHTAYRCPLEEGERFEDYDLVFDRAEEADTLLMTPQGLRRREGRERLLTGTTLPLDYALFDRLDTAIFQGLRSSSVRLVRRDTGRGVRVDFHEFPMVAFWTKPHSRAPFLCIEPWQGCADWEAGEPDFADKPWCVVLEPGGSWEAGFAVDLV